MRKAEKIKIEFTTESAAFDDTPATEIACILGGLAKKIERGEFAAEKSGGLAMGILRDINGVRVGTWSIKAMPNRR